MIYTCLLTLQELPTAAYYAYLAFYNLVFVTPLPLIVQVFVFTLGRRKLSEGEGRLLKLLSDLLMPGLKLELIPESLGNLAVAVGRPFPSAILLTGVSHRLGR